jgi:hypothetical protein
MTDMPKIIILSYVLYMHTHTYSHNVNGHVDGVRLRLLQQYSLLSQNYYFLHVRHSFPKLDVSEY